MEEVHRRAIRRSWTKIIDSVMPEQLVGMMDYMLENGILNMGMRDDILCERLESDKNRKLLSIVMKRGPRAFQIFVESLLQNDLNDLADIVLSHVEDTPAPIPPLPPTVPEPRPQLVNDSSNNVENNECAICMDSQVSVVLIPCGHTLCSQCGETVMRQKSCCFCKQDVVTLNRFFL